MSKVYVATFHGDIEGKPPMCAYELGVLLKDIQDVHGYGKCGSGADYEWSDWITPDPEDDKIEIWEYDPESKTGHVVCGFFGWHWTRPEGANDMVMPGNDKSLYELAMEE